LSDLIRLDLSVVSDAASQARTVKRTFDASDDSAHTAASACGHDGLAETVERFASTWDDRRRDFADNLDKLAGALGDIEQAFRELDLSLSTSEGGA
jgi:ABC-type transporter Mla subunit MlaD